MTKFDDEMDSIIETVRNCDPTDEYDRISKVHTEGVMIATKEEMLQRRVANKIALMNVIEPNPSLGATRVYATSIDTGKKFLLGFTEEELRAIGGF